MYNKIKIMWGIFKNDKIRKNRDWEKQVGRAVINK